MGDAQPLQSLPDQLLAPTGNDTMAETVTTLKRIYVHLYRQPAWWRHR